MAAFELHPWYLTVTLTGEHASFLDMHLSNKSRDSCMRDISCIREHIILQVIQECQAGQPTPGRRPDTFHCQHCLEHSDLCPQQIRLMMSKMQAACILQEAILPLLCPEGCEVCKGAAHTFQNWLLALDSNLETCAGDVHDALPPTCASWDRHVHCHLTQRLSP